MTIEQDRKFWDSKARSYSKNQVADEAGYQRTLDKTRTLLKPSDRVVELGCGTGSTALRLADCAQSYLATDISPEMIQIGNEKKAALSEGDEKLPGLSFRAATSEELAAETTRFTAVLGFNYLHLVPDIPQTLQSIHAMLEDGGLFISKTACLKDFSYMMQLAVLAVPLMQLIGQAPAISKFNEGQLLRMIQDAGFEIVETEKHATSGVDGRPYIVARKTGPSASEERA
jgi:ubiquinone/menaquinone biosynthesis C-methylase UbiE